MRKKILLAILLLLVGVNGVVGLSYYVHRDSGLKGNYINLIPPPPEALAASFGNPLLTTDIGLFAYYEAADWDLNDVIPAFQNYTQYSNYVDGYVRVWMDGSGTTFTGVDCYVDVSVRVRSDGWILAWLEDDDAFKPYIPHFGCKIINDDNPDNYPTDYHTCLSRAMWRVYHNAGVTWIDEDEIFYYDYEFSDATRLYILGQDHDESGEDEEHDYMYIILPNGVTSEASFMFLTAYLGTNGYGGHLELQFDDVQKYYTTTDQTYIGINTYEVSLSNDYKYEIDSEIETYHVVSHILVWFVIWSS